MDTTNQTDLMHLVLDGEASAGERARFDVLMRDELLFKRQFDALSRLFAVLRAVDAPNPPPKLADQAIARALSSASARAQSMPTINSEIRVSKSFLAASDQLIQPSSVVATNPGHSVQNARSGKAGSGSYFNPLIKKEGHQMSEVKKGFMSSPKGKVAIGAGAVAAIVVAVSVGLDFPKASTDTSGTIAPAQRYRAPQNTAADINVSAPGAQQAVTGGAAVTGGQAAGQAAGSAAGSARSAIESASGDAGGRAAGAASGAAAGSAKAAIENSAGEAAGRASGSAKSAIESSAGDAAGRAAGNAAGNAAGAAAGKASGSARSAIESSAGDAAGRAAGNAAGNAAGAAAGKASGSAKSAIESSAGDAAGRAAGNAAGNAAGAAAGAAAGKAAGVAAGNAAGNAAGTAAQSRSQ